MRDIFYELIEEAKNAKVNIDNEEWPIGFNTVIDDKYFGNKGNLSTLVIKNKEEFFELLEIYISKELKLNRSHVFFSDDIERNHIKSLMVYLFINMSTEDFLNPVECLRRRIGFLDDRTFSLFEETIDFNAIPGSKLLIDQSVQSIYMETPFIIDFTIEHNGNYFRLPYISYGICEENGEKVCYIYSIMNHPLGRQFVVDEKLAKKINRVMYKLNGGVLDSESQEYKDYKNGDSDDYVENISDVTPSFVFSLVTFLTMLQSKGITKVKAVPYLPVRYLSRDVAARRTDDPDTKKERKERNDQIQRNATDKFIRTFRRAAYHMNGVEVVSYPYEVDEFLTLDLHGRGINNEILQDVSGSILGR